MNILYIGPYHQKTILGSTSQAILINLLANKKHNISCKPLSIEINVGGRNQNIHPDIVKAEENSFDTYDTVVQHAPISSAIPIGGVKSNILLPIISTHDTTLDIDSLSQFTKILVDNTVDYQKLSSYKQLKNKIHVFNYHFDLAIDNNTFLNLGNINFSKKLYYIGNFNNNQDNILNICKSFISNVSHENVVLLIFLIYLQNDQKEQLEQYIKNIYKTSNKISYLNKIHVMGIDAEIKTLGLIHNTCDILINAEDMHSNSFNKKLNESYNKKILDFGIDDYSFTYERNGKFSPTGFNVISENSISTKIGQYLKNSSTSNKVTHSKKTNINELL
jgi:hypothetical protein